MSKDSSISQQTGEMSVSDMIFSSFARSVNETRVMSLCQCMKTLNIHVSTWQSESRANRAGGGFCSVYLSVCVCLSSSGETGTSQAPQPGLLSRSMWKKMAVEKTKATQCP